MKIWQIIKIGYLGCLAAIGGVFVIIGDVPGIDINTVRIGSLLLPCLLIAMDEIRRK